MTQRKCPQGKHGMCWDKGNCDDCMWNKLITRYERKVARLQKEVQQAHKETVKYVLQKLINHRFAIDDGDGNLIMFYLDKCDFRFIADEYGVEIDK